MDFNGVFTGKLHSDHRTPLFGFSDDFLNSKFWNQIWKLFVTSQCPSRMSNCHQKMQNLSSNNPVKFYAIWKILHVSVAYVGEKTPISDHRGRRKFSCLFHNHKMSLLALLSSLTDRNDRFPCPFIYFI